ncbi:MAG TPA: SET domain-containing protein [Saprospiraceae bacterium]|nr:SET domain-containing protein [Saprospiraceae bacterium]
MQQSQSLIIIGPSKKGGRGVFSTAFISKGTLIETCPVISMPKQARSKLDQTMLHDYYFIWGEADQRCALVLGYGSLYNHDYQPNAEYEPDYQHDLLSFYARQDIKAGEEITVNYSGDPAGDMNLWFKTC